MYLDTATIDRYGLLRHCDPLFNPGITIVAGPNESGKTLYLEGLLQLLDTDVHETLDQPPRLPSDPVGRVVIVDENQRYELDDESQLSDISPITPQQLATLFVIRDSDFALPNDRE